MDFGTLVALLYLLTTNAFADSPAKPYICITSPYFQMSHPHFDLSPFTVIDVSKPESQGFHPGNVTTMYFAKGQWITHIDGYFSNGQWVTVRPPLITLATENGLAPYFTHSSGYGPCPGTWYLYFGIEISAAWCGSNASPSPDCFTKAYAFLNMRAIEQAQLLTQARAPAKPKGRATAPAPQSSGDPNCYVDSNGLYHCTSNSGAMAADVSTAPAPAITATAPIPNGAPSAARTDAPRRAASIIYSIGGPPPDTTHEVVDADGDMEDDQVALTLTEKAGSH